MYSCESCVLNVLPCQLLRILRLPLFNGDKNRKMLPRGFSRAFRKLEMVPGKKCEQVGEHVKRMHEISIMRRLLQGLMEATIESSDLLRKKAGIELCSNCASCVSGIYTPDEELCLPPTQRLRRRFAQGIMTC